MAEAAPAPADAPGADPQATLEAWRARGAQRVDPVRFQFIEALARRAARHEGAARHLLDARLAQLMAAYADTLAEAPPRTATPATPAASGPLGRLVDQLGRHDPAAPASEAVRATATPHPAGPPELKALRQFRRTWSRLHADQRLTQAQAQVPDQAGPLNSYHLVHRSLALMRELAPDYLHRFVSYVDTLLWLDQAQGGAFTAGTARADGPKKAGRGRTG